MQQPAPSMRYSQPTQGTSDDGESVAQEALTHTCQRLRVLVAELLLTNQQLRAEVLSLRSASKRQA